MKTELYKRIREMAKKIGFDKHTHTYTFNGKPVGQSVTGFLSANKISDDFSQVNKHVLARAGTRGSMIHEIIEEWVNGTGEPVRCDELEQFKQFCFDNEIEPLIAEFRVGNENMCGTCDLACVWGGKLALADHKTGRAVNIEAVKVQLSFYAYLLGLNIKNGIVFHYPKNGDAQIITFELYNNDYIRNLTKKEIKND